ncbi:LysR family transcriptional regulator [Marinomonas ostreistagni]|uniref:LysR family transcriptional regulator n=1 Tax=Marinomonas ostreistagni TaxID=359209 RepID=UPI00195215CD|nr:LysR family transcriptional regulator [Marinomonas ostreistagni]MBM6550865.1 LysR family transcriptional regulator [Marinomonas ostreistagni]
MNIFRRDLNLLLLFHVLYQERNASRAAKLLSISQPALSHKLNKLRDEWHDPLFIKAPRGLTPTPKAHELAQQIRDIMPNLEAFYATQVEPDFRKRDDKIVIYTHDYFEMCSLSHLLKIMREQAPNVRFVIRNTRGELPRAELENGQCDLAIAGFYKDLPDTMRQQFVGERSYCVLASEDNPHIRGEVLDLDAYLQCEHLVVSVSGDLIGEVDLELERLGHKRKVVAGVSSHLAPIHIVQENPEIITTCFESVAQSALRNNPKLRVYPVPLDIASVRLNQVWHERTHADPLRRWVRELIYDFTINYQASCTPN